MAKSALVWLNYVQKPTHSIKGFSNTLALSLSSLFLSHGDNVASDDSCYAILPRQATGPVVKELGGADNHAWANSATSGRHTAATSSESSESFELSVTFFGDSSYQFRRSRYWLVVNLSRHPPLSAANGDSWATV
ncbi:unnamed protein product [Prunus armeniaca]